MRKQKEPVSAAIQYKGGRISAKKGVRYWPRRAVIGLIHLYRKLRPRATRGCCKYIPTCSQYGEEAVERYGALLGGVLAALGAFCGVIRFPAVAMTLCRKSGKKNKF